MSSTNRSEARQEHISDYYITPIFVIQNLLNNIIKLYPFIFCTNILDPCAGGDSTTKMSYSEALISIGVNKQRITTVDIRKDSKAEIVHDYLTLNCKNKYGIIITNPPFNIAQQVILKSLDDVVTGGLVIMLLRLNFFGGKSRKRELWDYYIPERCFVHSSRISFTGGRTDSIEYMHCIWRKGYKHKHTKLQII